MQQNREPKNEEDIGKKGSGSLQCYVQVDGKKRSYTTNGSAAAVPGSAIRVSIRCDSRKGKKLGSVARVLAFIDPLTGNLVVRMGMWDVSRNTRGSEIGPQVVWVSDVPVCDIDTSED